MEIPHPDFIFRYLGKGIGKGNAAVFDGFDFGSLKHDTALIGFFDGVIEASFFVLCDDFYTFCHTIHYNGIMPTLQGFCKLWYA